MTLEALLEGSLCSFGLKPTQVAKVLTSPDPLPMLLRKLRALYSGSLVTAKTKHIGHSIKSKSEVLKTARDTKNSQNRGEMGLEVMGQSDERALYRGKYTIPRLNGPMVSASHIPLRPTVTNALTGEGEEGERDATI